ADPAPARPAPEDHPAQHHAAPDHPAVGRQTPGDHRGPGLAPQTPRSRRHAVAMTVANLAALSAFLWPLVASAVPSQAQAAVPYIALALAPLAVVLVLATLDSSVRSAHTLALLAVLAALGAAIRVAST